MAVASASCNGRVDASAASRASTGSDRSSAGGGSRDGSVTLTVQLARSQASLCSQRTWSQNGSCGSATATCNSRGRPAASHTALSASTLPSGSSTDQRSGSSGGSNRTKSSGGGPGSSRHSVKPQGNASPAGSSSSATNSQSATAGSIGSPAGISSRRVLASGDPAGAPSTRFSSRCPLEGLRPSPEAVKLDEPSSTLTHWSLSSSTALACSR